MNPEHLMTLTGTLTRVTQDGAVNEYGDPTIQTTATTVKCWLYQTPGAEQTAEANWQSRVAELWLPAGTDVTGIDRITVGDIEWEFTSPPRNATNARTGQVSHIEANVKAIA